MRPLLKYSEKIIKQVVLHDRGLGGIRTLALVEISPGNPFFYTPERGYHFSLTQAK